MQLTATVHASLGLVFLALLDKQCLLFGGQTVPYSSDADSSELHICPKVPQNLPGRVLAVAEAAFEPSGKQGLPWLPSRLVPKLSARR